MSETQKVIKYCALALAFIIILTILSGILHGVAFITKYFGGDNTNNSELVRTVLNDNVVVLDIDLKTTNLTIKNGDEFAVETNNKYIDIKQDNLELSIEENKDNFYHKNNDLIIYIPDNTIFDMVSISSGSGKVKISTIEADEFYFSVGTGKISIGELIVHKETSIDGGVGKLEIKDGSIYNLRFDMGVGETIIKAKILGDSNISAGVGTIKLTLLGDENDYKIDVEKGLGSIIIDGDSVKSETTHGDGKNTIDIDGGVGSIKIEYMK